MMKNEKEKKKKKKELNSPPKDKMVGSTRDLLKVVKK